MKLIYLISVKLYSIGICLASLFNKKASERYKGVKQTFSHLKEFQSEKTVWFHCASLGEFEQGRSLIELFKKENPQYKIALSFFSPSGFEIRKDYEHADIVFYLPPDTRKNAKTLIKLLKPNLVFFIKYEFWYYYLSTLKKNNIPLYLVSGIFRKDQIFFKKYGKFFKKLLMNFTCLFVQNEVSYKLLEKIGIGKVEITGDTRFDRVYEISQAGKTYEVINKFVKDHTIFIAGSTWKPDEDLITEYINKDQNNLKYIIAPHVIKNENISRLESQIERKHLRYSEANNNNVSDIDVIIIDNIGMLSSLYAYADIAYIGGGFGAGIHNTLEAAVFGIPVVFGPGYQKFDEAKELIKRKAAFSISNYINYSSLIDKLICETSFRENAGKNASLYVNENLGASKRILKAVSENI